MGHREAHGEIDGNRRAFQMSAGHGSNIAASKEMYGISQLPLGYTDKPLLRNLIIEIVLSCWYCLPRCSWREASPGGVWTHCLQVI